VGIAGATEAPAKEWSRPFGGAGSDWATSVQQTQDGGYIITGYTFSYGSGGGDAWLIKTNNVGNKQWDRTFGGGICDWATSMQQTADGGYIIAGYTFSESSGGDAWLIKTGPDGERQWERTFGGAYRDCAFSVQQTSDSGYVMAGYTESYGSGGGDALIIKTDTDGNKEWEKVLGGKGNDRAYSIQETADGGYIIAGSTSSYGAGADDCWLIKLSGTEKSSKTTGSVVELRMGSPVKPADPISKHPVTQESLGLRLQGPSLRWL
jgi:hypothetical protein